MLKNLIFLLFAIVLINNIDCKISLNNQRHHYSDIYRDCGSQTGSIVGLNVTGCTKVPCIFVRGNNYTMDLQFSSKVDSSSATNEVYGVIAGIPVPFQLPNNNGCQLGLNCPLTAGSNNQESVTLPVLTVYPKLSLFVEWKVVDDKKNLLVCFKFPVTIQ